jgi:hypothetical protein
MKFSSGKTLILPQGNKNMFFLRLVFNTRHEESLYDLKVSLGML